MAQAGSAAPLNHLLARSATDCQAVMGFPAPRVSQIGSGAFAHTVRKLLLGLVLILLQLAAQAEGLALSSENRDAAAFKARSVEHHARRGKEHGACLTCKVGCLGCKQQAQGNLLVFLNS